MTDEVRRHRPAAAERTPTVLSSDDEHGDSQSEESARDDEILREVPPHHG